MREEEREMQWRNEEKDKAEVEIEGKRINEGESGRTQKKKKRKGRKEEKKEYKVGFWNVAGMENKDEEFREKLGEWDIVCLSETWLQRRGWERVRNWLPKGFVWEIQEAKKKNKKGRAMGGMIMGWREEIEIEEEEEEEEEGIITKKLNLDGRWWRIVGVYVNKDLEGKMDKLRRWMEDREEEVSVIIGGDFNARTGRKGGRWEEDENEDRDEERRKSRDGKINGEGRRLCGFLEELGWSILNGNVEGDEEGEWTYTGGNGGTVIDYVLADDKTREGVRKMRVEERVDSDHQPITVWVKGGKRRKRRGEVKKEKERRGVWTKEGKEKFEEYFGRMEEEKGKSVEERWRNLKTRAKETTRRVEKELSRKKKKGWWDEECRKQKKEVKEELVRWKQKGGGGEEYKRKKKEYRIVCEGKKRKERERWEREIESVKTERQVWKVVRRERGGKRRKVDQRIKMKDWERHFKELLGGVEERLRGKRNKRKREEDREEDISKEEIDWAIRKMKEKKAAGGDGITNEVWKYGGNEARKWIGEICNRVWRGEGWPEDWKEGVVVPIWKKGDGKRVENYRGITLLQTAYKIYTTILAGRIRKEMEEKKVLPPSQAGFRKGMGTVDHIYVLNYLINKKVEERRGKFK